MWRPDRRELLRAAASSAIGASLFGASCLRDRPRNVLFICCDDLNDWAGCLGGHPSARTPQLDRLAGRGVLFTRAYSDGTNCPSTRASVMTGLSPDTTRIYTYDRPLREWAPDAVSLPEHFRQQGYATLGGGKIFHEYDPDRFEEFYSPQQPNLAEYRVRQEVYGFPGKDMLNFGPLEFDEERMFDAQLAAWAGRHLEREHDRPFFLGVGFVRPHMPWLVPRQYFEPFPWQEIPLPEVPDDDRRDLPKYGRLRSQKIKFLRVVANDQWRQGVSAYLAALYFLDAQIGKLMAALDRGPNRERTVIALWSDHGFLLGHKSAWGKLVLWEQGTRVPLIIAAPGDVRPGRCDKPVTLVHLYPTLLDLCALSPRPGLDGVSLRPLLEQTDAPWEVPAVTSLDCGSHALRTRRYRYIRYADGSEELYDHDEDPHEWRNLALREDTAELRRELAARLPVCGRSTKA